MKGIFIPEREWDLLKEAVATSLRLQEGQGELDTAFAALEKGDSSLFEAACFRLRDKEVRALMKHGELEEKESHDGSQNDRQSRIRPG